MPDPVRFAIVGLGYGRTRLEMFAETSDAVLACVVDSNEERAKEASEEFAVAYETDLDAALERDDVDVVGIYTPSGTHRDLVVKVAAAGKHVLTTKPIEITLERVDEMLAACEKAGVRLFTEYHLRYFPDNYRAYAALASGALGRRIFGEFEFKCYRPQWYYEMDGGWRGTWALNGGGIMMNQCIHMVDMCLWYMGDAATVTAVSGTFNHEIEVEDTGVALLTMRDGSIATIVGTTCHRNDHRFYPPYGGGALSRAEVSAADGAVSVVDDVLVEHAIAEGEFPAATPPAVNVFEDVARAVRDADYRSPTLVTGRDARKSVEIVLALYESAKTGQRVELPLGGSR